jgi:hypothetical protein
MPLTLNGARILHEKKVMWKEVLFGIVVSGKGLNVGRATGRRDIFGFANNYLAINYAFIGY